VGNPVIQSAQPATAAAPSSGKPEAWRVPWRQIVNIGLGISQLGGNRWLDLKALMNWVFFWCSKS
jgi:hypothetical protein